MLQGNIFRRLDAFEIGEKNKMVVDVFMRNKPSRSYSLYAHVFFSILRSFIGILSVFFEPSSHHFPIRKI